MFSKCKKFNQLSCDSIIQIEKWVCKNCVCEECLSASNKLDTHINSITIQRHPTFIHNNLFLTSKMLIKINLEIIKKQILKLSI